MSLRSGPVANFFGACRKREWAGVHGWLAITAQLAAPLRSRPMILNALALTLKRQARDDFRGRHFEATLIVQAVSWYLRYALSYRDIEEMLLERGQRWLGLCEQRPGLG